MGRCAPRSRVYVYLDESFVRVSRRGSRDHDGVTFHTCYAHHQILPAFYPTLWRDLPSARSSGRSVFHWRQYRVEAWSSPRAVRGSISSWLNGSGRIGPAESTKTNQQIRRLTASLDTKTKLSLDDILNQIAMLLDVTGRVGLMKRDLGELMKSLRKDTAARSKCAANDKDWRPQGKHTT